MEYPTSNRFEREESNLLRLFENWDFREAKTSADQMVQVGYLRPLICGLLRNSFDRLKIHYTEKAIEAAYIFKDYDFPFWLPEDLRQ